MLNSAGDESLQLTISSGHTDIVSFLLQNGADPNRKGSNRTLLNIACQKGFEDIVALLLEYGVKSTQMMGAALGWACAEGHTGIVRLLFENGAVAKVENSYFLRRASESDYREAVLLVMEKVADSNDKGILYGAALKGASNGSHTDFVHFLLRNGADPNAIGTGLPTPLKEAATEGHVEIVRLLLEYGADANLDDNLEDDDDDWEDDDGGWDNERNALLAASSKGDRALEAASGYDGDVEIVRLPFENGAYANTHPGTRALQAAAKLGYLEIVRLLVENGANIDADLQNGVNVKIHGGEALAIAARKHHRDVVRLLCENGATVTPPDVPTHISGNVIDLGFCSPSLFMAITATVDPSHCLGSEVALGLLF
ncbi:ankyrin repeat-containing domain protein [Mycena olivaceomarginata]|nr:ankyrin repeat-containing domain protein [Mycena olivaceomarginata]